MCQINSLSVSLKSPCLIPFPSVRQEICMSDSTHCQLLHSPLSSSAFLNMHALHFPTTFQIQMDVPCSRLYSLLPPIPSCLCSLQLCFICGWPNFSRFDPSCGFEADCESGTLTDRQIDTKAHRQAGMDASPVPITVPTIANEPITLRLLVPNPAPLLLSLRLQTYTHTHTHTLHPSCSSTTPVWSEERIGGSSIVSLIGCYMVGC